MMIEKYLDFPVKILDKRIPKKELLENLNLNSSQKKYLKEIEKINILYLLNKDTVNISPFIDEIYDYSSILVLEVTLKSDKHLKQLSSILQLIPQNLMIFFIYDDKITLSLASKRINKNNPTKMVIEKEYIFTFDNSNDLAKLDFSKAIKTNLFVFYRYYIDLIVSFELKKHSINDADENILEKIKEIENKINLLRKELKQTVNLNEKVEINMEIHRLKEELNRLKVNYVNMD
jgi:hypothetical protein